MKKRLNLDACDVAKTYWSIKVRERTYKRLAQLLGIEDQGKNVQNQLGRLVMQWEARGRVQHLVLPDTNDEPGYLPRNTDLEDRVRRLFGLRGVLAVDVTATTPSGTPSTAPDVWNTYDDLIHQSLGMWASRVLMAIIRPGDTLGTGGGRGPYHTANACNPSAWGSHGPERIASLTGRMSTRVWAERGSERTGIPPRNLDADGIASLLAHIFSTKVQPRRLDRSITAPGGKPSVKAADIDAALIGIGAVAGGHRLVNYEDNEDLENVSTDLRRLKALVQGLEAGLPKETIPFHHWVGDVCNCLFVVDDIPNSPYVLPPHQRDKLNKEIDLLNRRFLNTTPKVLTAISNRGAVLAVAGGPHKAAAIAHVLRHGRQRTPWITHLVTDVAVARYLLTHHSLSG